MHVFLSRPMVRGSVDKAHAYILTFNSPAGFVQRVDLKLPSLKFINLIYIFK